MTTFPTSVIQLYTNALIANLRDGTKHPNLANVTITDGPPAAPILEISEWIMFGDVDGEQNWAVIARDRLPKNEVFTIEVLISCIQQTTPYDFDAQSVVNERAIALLAELENELRTSPDQGIGATNPATQGGYVIASEIRTPYKLEKRANDTVREAAFRLGIEVKARL